LLTLVGTVPLSYAGPILIPAGLSPGNQYRLVFVTADGYTATDADLADYNTFVNTEANASPLAALGATWYDIGSTESDSANVNVPADPSIPIYNLAGQLVATDGASAPGGIFSGDIMNPIDYDENGNVEFSVVWTGSLADGSTAGNVAIGDQDAETGASQSTNNWLYTNSLYFYAFPYALYGISSVLTVPASPTPEPSTTILMALGGAILISAMRRKRRASPSSQERRAALQLLEWRSLR
jgi:hypothetical protein